MDCGPDAGVPPSTHTPAPVCAAVGMGANLGRRRATLLTAWHDLHSVVHIRPLRLSLPYRSEPLGMASEHWFINAVALLETTLPPLALLHLLLDLEKRHGRLRRPQPGYQDRSLDLDLLFFGTLCLHSEQLTLPHPRLEERLFVLAPLAELLPHWRHPLCKRSACELYKQLVQRNTQQVEPVRWEEEGRCLPGLDHTR